MEDELVLVLDHADRNPQFHRPARLALRDPARVRLEDGEHLLLVRNPLSLQQTPVDLVDLASRVGDVAPDQAAFRFLDAFPDQCLDGPFGPLDQIPAQPQIRLHLLRRLLASPCRAHRIEPLLHPLAQMCCRQPPTPCAAAARAVSRIRHRTPSHSKPKSVG